MAREIKQKNLFELLSQSAKEIGYKTLSAYAFMIVLFVVIAVTFLLAQQRQNLQQNASYDASTRTFKSTFDGNPSIPQPFTQTQQSDWDVQIHLRDPQYWYKAPRVHAHHGPNCQSPNDATNNTHPTDVFEELVFICKDHIMTALDGAEYGMIYLTPNAMVDFSQGEAVIKWDMSTLRTSDRDWIDVWITPFEQSLALPLEEWIPDGQGQPKNAIHIRMDGSGTSGPLDGAFKIFVVTNGVEKYYVPHWNPYNKFLTPDKARRDTFELRISKNRIRLTMPGYNQVLQEGNIPTLAWDKGIVQFGHHSYNPYKSVGVPDTWHWDNVTISPSIPFTMIKGDKRYVDQNNQTVQFSQPAPIDSYLRFSAIGSVEVSYDEGSTWSRAKRIDGNREHSPEHFSTFLTAMPAGAKNVRLRFSPDSWYGGSGMPYMAKDFAVWSMTSIGSNPTNTPAPSPTSPIVTNPPNPTATPTTAATPTFVPANSVLSIDPATRSVVRGDTFSAQVKVNTNGQTINGVEAGITYPSQLLDVVSATGNTSVFDVEAENTISSGRINLAFGSTTPRSGSNLTVATITLRAKAAGTATLSFTSSAIISSTSNTNVSKQATGATYTITNPTPTPTTPPTPTSTPIPTATPTPVAKAGDLNGDNKVNIQDLSYLLSKWGRSDAIADINKDGRVNTLDLSILLSNWGK